jgi:cell division septum initiation protein DivIVA
MPFRTSPYDYLEESADPQLISEHHRYSDAELQLREQIANLHRELQHLQGEHYEACRAVQATEREIEQRGGWNELARRTTDVPCREP